MKSILLITSIFIFNSFVLRESPNDFDYRLSDIVRKFKLEIMDKDECEKQKRAADDLSDDINDAIKNTDEYNYDEIIELKKLEKEAEALEEFIAAVGNCGNYIPSIKIFNLANKRVGASVVSIVKDKYCVDVISVTIGNHVAYLGENNSTNNYTITYKWKTPNAMNSGNGTMGLSALSVRHIYDNREKPIQKNISILGITCKEF
jgi:hypothetical protein